ncbi:MAG: glutamate synthase subunit alpha, partial [bacterium]
MPRKDCRAEPPHGTIVSLSEEQALTTSSHFFKRPPKAQGLYDPAFEKDSCGVGFVVNFKGVKSHDIVLQGLQVLENLTHRGATAADPLVGDGAGMLMQMPHRFFSEAVGPLGFSLPDAGAYGVGMIFLPMDEKERARCESIINDKIGSEGQKVLGWRTVPVVVDGLGDASREVRPYIRQVFVTPPSGGMDQESVDQDSLERKLYVIRRLIEKAAKEAGIEDFSIPSMSCRTI